jgi:hypothetical protein
MEGNSEEIGVLSRASGGYCQGCPAFMDCAAKQSISPFLTLDATRNFPRAIPSSLSDLRQKKSLTDFE